MLSATQRNEAGKGRRDSGDAILEEVVICVEVGWRRKGKGRSEWGMLSGKRYQ